jgi:hypothetical protein
MIVSHEYKFVIAVPCGLNAADWIGRIVEEGEPGFLEVVGLGNGVCVPEGCEKYTRFFVDSPRHRLPQMWFYRQGTPWEGPKQVQDPNDPTDWLAWYCWSMRRQYLAVGLESSPNGWGMRGEDGDWVYFEAPAILARTFAGIGNSPLGEEAPWGRAEIRIVYMEEPSKGWREIVKKVVGSSVEAKQTRDLLNWHVPISQLFYEIGDELASTYLRDAAWMFKAQKGIE